MLSKCYESFILECIKILEENELYGAKLMQLKKITKSQARYLGIMTDFTCRMVYTISILCILIRNCTLPSRILLNRFFQNLPLTRNGWKCLTVA